MTTTLYHNMHYNKRQQLYDIRLGSNTDGMGTEWTWNRGALRLFYNSDLSDYGTPSGANNNGNLYRVDTFVPTNDTATEWAMSLDYYGYDHLNRITGIWENKQAHNLAETTTNLTQQYVYDRYGNRTVNNAVSTFPVQNSPYNVTTASNRLQKTGNCMVYDLAGNLTDDCGRTRAYDGNNKMISAYDAGVATSYRYNADGQRVIKTVGTVNTWYIYGMGGELIAEYPANGATNMPQMEYGYRGGELLIEGGCDVVRWKVSDHLDSTRMSVDRTGALGNVKRTDYLPFGEEIGATVGIRTAAQGYSQVDCWKQKFTGYEKDTETGLDYAQARYYASVQGRFISADPLYLELRRLIDPQQLNIYTYSRNNPLKYKDPDGLDIFFNGSEADANDYLKRLQENVSFSISLEQVDDTGNYKIVLSDPRQYNEGVVGTLQGGDDQLYHAITGDTRIDIVASNRDASVDFGRFDGNGKNTIDFTDVSLLDAPANAGGLTGAQVVGHETLEAYEAARTGANKPNKPHDYANQYFGGLEQPIESTISPYGVPNVEVRGVTFELPIHRGNGVNLEMTREFVTPIPIGADGSIPAGPHPAHITKVAKKP